MEYALIGVAFGCGAVAGVFASLQTIPKLMRELIVEKRQFDYNGRCYVVIDNGKAENTRAR
jgi:hypothetical protein